MWKVKCSAIRCMKNCPGLKPSPTQGKVVAQRRQGKEEVVVGATSTSLQEGWLREASTTCSWLVETWWSEERWRRSLAMEGREGEDGEVRGMACLQRRQTTPSLGLEGQQGSMPPQFLAHNWTRALVWGHMSPPP